MEDLKVNYSLTVHNERDQITQFNDGDDATQIDKRNRKFHIQ